MKTRLEGPWITSTITVAFSHWRLAAIAQGVYKRYLVDAMGDQEFDLEKYHESIVAKARMAVSLLSV